MEEQTKKWVLIGVSVAGMGIFCYYTFYEPTPDAQELTNPAAMEDSPSRQSLNAEKRKKNRMFAYDRKISSIDNFLKNEVEEDPFDTMAIVKADTVVEKDAMKTEEVPIKYRTIVKVIEAPTLDEEEGETERRKGFSSGDVVIENPVIDDGYEPVNIAVVVHEEVMVTSGSFVKLRTLNYEASLSANSFLVGKAKISGDRLYISVPDFMIKGMEKPIELEAFDTQGIHGLLITGGGEITDRAIEDVVGEVQRNVDVPLLRNLPFTSAQRKIREKAILLRSGTKFFLREL